MLFVHIAGKNLLRRKIRTFFTILGIATAVAAFISLVGLSRGLENAWMTALLERDTHLFVSPKGVVDIMTSSIDETAAASMAEIPGVLDVSGELVDLVLLESGEMAILAGWPQGSYLWNSVELTEGALPTSENKNGVVVGNLAADALGYSVGSTFTIRSTEFTVTGVSKAGGAMRNSAMVLTLPALQELSNRKGKVSTFNLRVTAPDDEAHVAMILKTLNETFVDFTFTETRSLADNNHILKIFRAMAWGTSIIAIFIGLVMVMNTLLMTVVERTGELGLLSAVGWHPARIVAIIVSEGLLLTIVGSGFGTIFGVVGITALADTPQMRGLIEPALNSRMVIEVVVATVILGCCGSAYPAWRATRLRPAQALRHE